MFVIVSAHLYIIRRVPHFMTSLKKKTHTHLNQDMNTLLQSYTNIYLLWLPIRLQVWWYLLHQLAKQMLEAHDLQIFSRTWCTFVRCLSLTHALCQSPFPALLPWSYNNCVRQVPLFPSISQLSKTGTTQVPHPKSRANSVKNLCCCLLHCFASRMFCSKTALRCTWPLFSAVLQHLLRHRLRPRQLGNVSSSPHTGQRSRSARR